MTPSAGRIVHYTLSQYDADSITAARGALGIQANAARAGQVYAAVIVQVWGTTPGSAANLQVLMDGPDSYWATSRTEGDGPGTWAWPPRVGD